MNFYFDAAKIIDRLDAKHGSVKSLLNTLPEKSRKRTAALVIETLKCRRTPCRALIDYCSTHTLSARQAGACGSDRSGKSLEGREKDNLPQPRIGAGSRPPPRRRHPSRRWSCEASTTSAQDSPPRGVATPQNQAGRQDRWRNGASG